MSSSSYQLRSASEITTTLSDYAWRILETFVEPIPQPIVEEIPLSTPTEVTMTLSTYEQAWHTVQEWVDSQDPHFMILSCLLAICFIFTCTLSYRLSNTNSRLRSLESLVGHLRAQVAEFRGEQQQEPEDEPKCAQPQDESDNSHPEEEEPDHPKPDHKPQFEFIKDYYIQWETIEYWRRMAAEDFADYSKCHTFPCPPAPQIDAGGLCPGTECHIYSGPLPLAACCIRKIFSSVPGLDLKSERRKWHPDRFRAVSEDRREQFTAYAHQIFVVLEDMYREELGGE